MRPTGKLHLGHLVGALDNWVRLQNDYECFYCIVDWHALTTHYDSTAGIREAIIDNALDWLAAGSIPSARRCSSSRMSWNMPNCICCFR